MQDIFFIALFVAAIWLWIASGVWLYRDAELRGANAVGWLIAWLIGWLVTLVIWLAVRPPRPDAS